MGTGTPGASGSEHPANKKASGITTKAEATKRI